MSLWCMYLIAPSVASHVEETWIIQIYRQFTKGPIALRYMRGGNMRSADKS